MKKSIKNLALSFLVTTLSIGIIGCGSQKAGDGNGVDEKKATESNYQINYINFNDNVNTDVNTLTVPVEYTYGLYSSKYDQYKDTKEIYLNFKGGNIAAPMKITDVNSSDVRIKNDNITIYDYKRFGDKANEDIEEYSTLEGAFVNFQNFYGYNLYAYATSAKNYEVGFDAYKEKMGNNLKELETVNGYTFYMQYKDGKEFDYFAVYTDIENGLVLRIGSPYNVDKKEDFRNYIVNGNITYDIVFTSDKYWDLSTTVPNYVMDNKYKKNTFLPDCIANALRNSGIELKDSNNIDSLSRYTKIVCKERKAVKDFTYEYNIDLINKDHQNSEPAYYLKKHEDGSIVKADDANGVYEVVSNNDTYDSYFLKTKTGLVFEYHCTALPKKEEILNAGLINEKIINIQKSN